MDSNHPAAKLKVILSCKPGLLRNSLRAFLGGLLDIKVVAQVEDHLLTPDLLHSLNPDVLVMNPDLRNPAVCSLITQVRVEFPALNCIVLVDNSEQQRLALACGANHALLKGMLDDQFREAILMPPGSAHP